MNCSNFGDSFSIIRQGL